MTPYAARATIKSQMTIFTITNSLFFILYLECEIKQIIAYNIFYIAQASPIKIYIAHKSFQPLKKI